jgi:hypothetical protein
VIGVLIALVLGWVLWVGLYTANPAIRATVVAYKVTSDHAVTVQFDVTKDRERAGTCVIRARDRSGAEVGRREVTIPAGTRKTSLTEELATSGRPVSGEIRDCRLLSR